MGPDGPKAPVELNKRALPHMASESEKIDPKKIILFYDPKKICVEKCGHSSGLSNEILWY